MSLYDYKMSQESAVKNYPFYSLIMTAMRQADTSNLAKLRDAFPDTWMELNSRYHSVGGILPSDEMDGVITITEIEDD